MVTTGSFVAHDLRNEDAGIEAFGEQRGVRVRIGQRGIAADDDGVMVASDFPNGDILMTPQDAYELGTFLRESANLKADES